MMTIADRKKEAKAYRKIVPRSSLGLWEVQTKRPVVEQLLVGNERKNDS